MKIKDNIILINKCNIDVQSFLLLLNDEKPVMRIGFYSMTFKYLVKLCDEYNLILIVKTGHDVFGTDFTPGLLLGYIAKSKSNAEKTYLYEKAANVFSFGEMLGYPKCCINNFIQILNAQKSLNKNDFIHTTSEKTMGDMHYQCNNIYHFESKLIPGVNIELYQKNYDQIFRKCEKFFLVKHVPCSYDCEISISIGNRTLELLNRELPKYAETISLVLKKPILYFDYFCWLVLDGYYDNNVFKYSRILPIRSLVEKPTTDLISRGNILKIKNGQVSVYCGNDKIDSIKTSSGAKILAFI